MRGIMCFNNIAFESSFEVVALEKPSRFDLHEACKTCWLPYKGLNITNLHQKGMRDGTMIDGRKKIPN